MDPSTVLCPSNSPLLAGLSDDERREVLAQGRVRRVPRRGVLLRQDQPADHLFVCCYGRIKITQVSAEGAEIILRVIAPGDIFGGFGALIDASYPATAEALEASAALAWTRRGIERLIERFPRLARNLTTILAHRLREAEDRLRELATERVAQRLARALMRLARFSGRRIEQGVLLDVRLSREELAQLSGTTLFSASRLLSDWRARGLLGAHRGRIVLRDTHSLVALADDLATGTGDGPPAGPRARSRAARKRNKSLR